MGCLYLLNDNDAVIFILSTEQGWLWKEQSRYLHYIM